MATPGLDGWIKERLGALLSPTDIVMNLVRRRLRQDQTLVDFANSNEARIQAFGWFQPRDFSLVPGITIWPELSGVTTSAGCLLSEAKINVGLRLWVNEIHPLDDQWGPGISTLVFHLYRVLLADQQLLYNINGEDKIVADRVDVSDENSARDREFPDPKAPGRLCMTIGRTVTYHVTVDPLTGQPFAFSGGT